MKISLKIAKEPEVESQILIVLSLEQETIFFPSLEQIKPVIQFV